MKKLIRICLIVSASLLVASRLPAQTFKWEYIPPYGALSYNGDRHGGLAVCEIFPGEKGRCVWIAPNGRPQFTNEFELAPDFNRRCDIVRLTPGELAIQFRTQQSSTNPVVNVLRRFKKTTNGIAISETILHPNEDVPLVLPQMSDPFGFFTTGTFFTDDRRQYFSIRRYSNR
jgi:hypothetical protein